MINMRFIRVPIFELIKFESLTPIKRRILMTLLSTLSTDIFNNDCKLPYYEYQGQLYDVEDYSNLFTKEEMDYLKLLGFDLFQSKQEYTLSLNKDFTKFYD